MKSCIAMGVCIIDRATIVEVELENFLDHQRQICLDCRHQWNLWWGFFLFKKKKKEGKVELTRSWKSVLRTSVFDDLFVRRFRSCSRGKGKNEKREEEKKKQSGKQNKRFLDSWIELQHEVLFFAVFLVRQSFSTPAQRRLEFLLLFRNNNNILKHSQRTRSCFCDY